jgi:archaemetzincin
VQIILQPATINLDNKTLNHFSKDITKEFKDAKVTVASLIDPDTEASFRSAFDTHRNQWDSFKLLEWLLEKFKPAIATKILAIFDIDAYSSGFDFVFGEAYYGGRVAAIYLSRLKQQFYDLKPNSLLFYQRLVKEAIHELGHACGIAHCKNTKCVMNFSTSLRDIDNKERSFCKSCNRKHFR